MKPVLLLMMVVLRARKVCNFQHFAFLLERGRGKTFLLKKGMVGDFEVKDHLPFYRSKKKLRNQSVKKKVKKPKLSRLCRLRVCL